MSVVKSVDYDGRDVFIKVMVPVVGEIIFWFIPLKRVDVSLSTIRLWF